MPQQTSSLNQPPSLDSRIANGTNSRHTYSIQEMRERNYESLGAREGSEGSRDARKHKFRIDSSFIGYKKGKLNLEEKKYFKILMVELKVTKSSQGSPNSYHL